MARLAGLSCKVLTQRSFCSLCNVELLRDVRKEIKEHISFTPKETDIYKIQQSGDLANLDGLDEESLSKLSSVQRLRDAMYSSAFRKYIAGITGSGPLSGVKTDMAINVYTPGCHLLCHDDVIGTRRVSYILYLLDPDHPWKPEWGGALRLFPTEILKNDQGEEVRVPLPDPTVVIPPAFNQLSFFTVQPGESFHDVEEVYKRAAGEDENDGGRERMAISGWFHIPQEGEEGYEEGLEEKLAKRSSLAQLQGGKADQFDEPQPDWHVYPSEAKPATNGNADKGKSKAEEEEDEEPELTGADLNFLIRFINPSYLTPDTVEELNQIFANESSLQLSDFLNDKFAAPLKAFIEAADKEASPTMPGPSTRTGVARPPHKHRYLYRNVDWDNADKDTTTAKEKKLQAKQSTLSPLDELLDVLFVSTSFQKWLGLVMGLTMEKANIVARRFRKGMDYTLATSLEQSEPQLEMCLGLTPSKGWGGDSKGDEDDEEEEGKPKAEEEPEVAEEELPGGYEMYMAPDDDDDDAGSDHGVEIPSNKGSTGTGAGKRREKADPAVYRSAGDGADDGVLASFPAAWNTLSVVLRDTGVLRFVKYVSQSAQGDRWDVAAEFGVNIEADEE